MRLIMSEAIFSLWLPYNHRVGHFSILQLAQLIASRIDPGCRALHAWHLKGGVSAEVFAFEMMDLSGETRKLIVRRHGAADFSRNSQIAAVEFRLLTVLHDLKLPVPQPYFLDGAND